MGKQEKDGKNHLNKGKKASDVAIGHYDICIVGGGIQGCGTALLSALNGYSVILVEQQVLGWATSSRSSKLIHGGLRYLQTGQFKLVRECLKERKWMLDNLPELVQPNWFYIPIYKNSHHPAWQIHVGLLLYRLLAGCDHFSRFRRVPRRDWSGEFPGLNTNGLKAVYAYQDAQTDDRKLTRFIAGRCKEHGAHIMEHCRFVGAEQQAGSKAPLHFRIELLDNKNEIRTVGATVIVNAGGPWINPVLDTIKTDTPLRRQKYDLVQGAHIFCTPQLAGHCFYLEAPDDHRAVFILPYQGKTLVGTTEMLFSGDPAGPQPTQQEIDYLQRTVKAHFPDYHYSIKGSFAGLRVLPKSRKSAFRRSRKTQIRSEQQVISLYGGKLTSWRVSAIKVLKLVEAVLGERNKVNPDDLFIPRGACHLPHTT